MRCEGGCQLHTQQTSVTCCHQWESRRATGTGPSVAASSRGPGSTYRRARRGDLRCLRAEVSTDARGAAAAHSQANSEQMETETLGNNDADAHVHFLVGSSKSQRASQFTSTAPAAANWGETIVEPPHGLSVSRSSQEAKRSN
ncbi:unnamed protein product [Pleuronectes platessa]|uniref:Uncharacterized protein n=1 Tax=Pleuronectes platessa TaxID=8262 RepID=A0A9N7UYB7_PLEPL|nr:unnamed protein product [Pleuronectes platessa]